jgi:hypothetical protein
LNNYDGRDLYFIDHYQIKRLDNIELTKNPAAGHVSPASEYIYLNNCGNAVVDDVTWSNLTFNSVTNDSIVTGSPCTGIGPITVSGSGPGYGPGVETDPSDVINWTNGTIATCTWTGAASAAWADTANWSGCANGRGGVPDQNDWVVIPAAAATQPTVSAFQAILGFGPSTGGGGTVTIDAGAELRVLHKAATVQSSVKFAGGSSGCTTCLVRSVDLNVVNDATLTLLPDITLRIMSGGLIGSWTQAGHLVVQGGSDPARYPTIDNLTPSSHNRGGFYVRAPSTANRSSIDIQGVNMLGAVYVVPEYVLQENARIDRFDDITFDTVGPSIPAGAARVSFSNCTGILVNDTTWSNLVFADTFDAGAYNIQATHATCSSWPAIDVTGSGSGYGPTFEDDPYDLISWQ